MSPIRLSAIITTYNNGTFVADALRSVLGQSYPADEIIIVDDGSTDGTQSIVEDFQAQGAAVRYINQPNSGPSMARNRGIQESAGEFIAFLDADDMWLLDKTRIQMQFLESHPEIYIVSGLAWVWEDGSDHRELSDYKQRSPGVLRRDILINNDIGNPSMVIFRRAALDAVGVFNRDLRFGEDWDLWIRIASQFDIQILSEPVITYRVHGANLSHMDTLDKYNKSWQISKKAIANYPSLIWRPVLLARSRSYHWLHLARGYAEMPENNFHHFLYAAGSLLVYPFDDALKKIREIFRSIVSDRVYRKLKRAFMHWLNSASAEPRS